MTDVVALKQPAFEAKPAIPDAQIDWLMQSVLKNRFLPSPDPNSVFVGDGDYRAVGAEFLGHFIRKGGLRRDARVLDIGSGIGRMAVPLTQYLDPAKARYSGIDPVAGGVNWCRQNITSRYPNFEFRHIDIAHDLYNPKGAVNGLTLTLPFADKGFDFIIMTSVVTHLPSDEVKTYLDQVSRVLAPGGKLFMTAFVVDDVAARDRHGKRDKRLAFERHGSGPCWFVPELPPLAAVGFENGFLDRALAGAKLTLETKSFGHWRGIDADHYQDIFIASRGVA
ncbi:class I SAM-dependent methyltransferase [Brucella tritici]|uniref:Class I SAM-dependent methyltransferase n=1 Tax=Brucella tritici TaxID=94626 RepID=A0A7X6FS85_9HYPH|nr:class I SAM-dependent methyltransferase [Brucella tritici]KAB2664379.1 class I SAM-dependent methyltransferase [Brucella tritici]MBJ6719397.1 class I SAM-dependent methyltransferase [Bacillus sp. PR5]NKW10983.1 class I SAM-dependent methyltransferase [Brucella tritici]